jgi:hypothetical protein
MSALLPRGSRSLVGRLRRALDLSERYGERCGGPVLLVGAVLGSGVVQLASGPLGQTSRFSLELLILLMLKLTGPMLVAILAMALLLPLWLAEERPEASGPGVLMVPAAGLAGALLQLMLLLAALMGGLLASPRADLIGEWSDLLSGLQWADVLRSMLRAALFLAGIGAWTLWRGRHGLRAERSRELLTSNLLVEGLMVLMSLKLAWIMAIEPLRLSAGAS